MQKILQVLELIPDWTQKFQFFVDKNNLSTNLVARLQSHNIESLNKHLQKLQIDLYSRSQQNRGKNKISWVSSQYQALEIVLNSLSVISNKIIQDFNLPQWEQIYEIFPYKVPLTVKYESLRIVMDKKQTRRRWVAPEQNFLIEIVRSFTKKNKWNDVARQLFIKSDGQYFRQGKHCRERWLNHLHPSIQNNDWTPYEDLQLLSFVLKKGKKWARIAKKFEMKRSECMVKKRFFQLIKMEEQDGLSMETLRTSIKTALQQIRTLMSQKKEYKKQELNNQQFVDKNYHKGSILKENLKSQSDQKLILLEKKSLQTKQKSEGSQIIEQSKKQWNYYQNSMAGQQFQTLMPNYGQIFNNQGYFWDYFSYMNSFMSYAYPGYNSMNVLFQKNIFINHQGLQDEQSSNM